MKMAFWEKKGEKVCKFKKVKVWLKSQHWPAKVKVWLSLVNRLTLQYEIRQYVKIVLETIFIGKIACFSLENHPRKSSTLSQDQR